MAVLGCLVVAGLLAAARAGVADEYGDTQLMQLLLQDSQATVNDTSATGCHTTVAGDACFEKVMWVKRTGMAQHPEWYRPLSGQSSLEDIQWHLHGVARLSDVCPKPCAPKVERAHSATQSHQRVSANGTSAAGCHTSVKGDPCFDKVMWVIKTGMTDWPEWYLPLTKNSSFEDIQRHLHRVARLSEVCPMPCAPLESRQRIGASESQEREYYSVAPTPVPTPTDYVPPTPNPTAIHLGTPMPTEIHLDDLLTSSYPGFERAGRNCKCGNFIRSFSEEHAELEVCAEECNLYPHCKSFGLHPWQSIWRGHCDLYDAACDDTDGHAADTTCSDPTPVDAFSVNFNRVPTTAPTPAPTPAPDPCDVVDGSGPSSAYPCMCGPDQCSTNELCATDTCSPIPYLQVEWPCGQQIGSPYFQLDGLTAGGSPVYQNGDGTYIYWDHSCDGFVRPLEDQRPRWIVDQQEPSRTATMDLDNDGACAYYGHHGTFESAGVPLGTHQWTIACDGQIGNMSVTITMNTPAPTPAPTLQSGKPCACAEQCGTFAYMDLDGDGCLFLAEAEKIPEFQGNFAEMDLDGDGCLNQTECAESPFSADLPSFPIIGPAECDYGYYFLDGTSVCQECLTGETRRRRSEYCTPCPPDKEDLGEFDNCIGGVYLTGPVEAGDDLVFVNKAEDESGVLLTVGDGITMSTRNPGHYERVIVVGKVGFDDDHRLPGAREIPAHEKEELLRTRGPFFVLDHGLHNGFNKFDAIVSACTGVNGLDLSGQYPCGCGIEICNLGYRCDEECGENNTILNAAQGLSFGTGGCCLGPPQIPVPTPVPTVSAKGDPHLVNLQGEHFDVNHEGEFTLLRIPQALGEPAELELNGTVRSEHGKPCTTYITEVQISGSWFGGKLVQVRSYLRSHAKDESDRFLSIRVLRHPGDDTAAWTNITDWTVAEQVLYEQDERHGPFQVSLSKKLWHSRKSAGAGAPTVAGQFALKVQNKQSDGFATITVRQDLPSQEHLNMAVRHLSKLGRLDVGGLLGFDDHPASLEDVTLECQRRRDGLDTKRGTHTQKGWKTRWTKIKEQRQHHASEGDTDAGASLSERDLMCVCTNGERADDLVDEGQGHTEQLVGSGPLEGVIAEFQTGRLAEASWD